MQGLHLQKRQRHPHHPGRALNLLLPGEAGMSYNMHMSKLSQISPCRTRCGIHGPRNKSGVASFLLIVLLFFSVSALADYSAVIDDLPLMPQMRERPDETLVFDKPNGRIVEINAEVPGSAAIVMDFYRTALPPLGWKALPNNKFLRDHEVLEITVEPQGGSSLVRFNLTPEGK